MNESESWNGLARSLAAVLQEFADNTGSTEPDDPEPSAGQPPRPADEHALGKRQHQIVELPEMTSDRGLKTAAIAAAIEYEVPNTYTALQALARSQVVERVPGKEPQHWRLVRRYRAGSQVYAQLAALVGAGEWTTAGDISIAGRGDLRAAEAVARADLSHRVRTESAVSHEARQRLVAEGVDFLDDHNADPRQRVSWDELARRASASKERRRTMTTGVLNYVQIPVTDLEESITFYEQVFGWTTTRYPSPGSEFIDQSGYAGFADSTGQNGGEFVLGRLATSEPGLLPCIHVDSIADTLDAVIAHGGKVVKPRAPIVDGVDWEAMFRDPAGNVFGLFEQASP